MTAVLRAGDTHIEKTALLRGLEALWRRKNELQKWVVGDIAGKPVPTRIDPHDEYVICLQSLSAVKCEKPKIDRISERFLPFREVAWTRVVVAAQNQHLNLRGSASGVLCQG